MSEFTLPLVARDRGWIELREQIAHAARELHFYATSSQTVNGAALLVIAGNLAELAMSIPMAPSQAKSDGFANASTLLAASVLQDDLSAHGGANIVTESK